MKMQTAMVLIFLAFASSTAGAADPKLEAAGEACKAHRHRDLSHGGGSAEIQAAPWSYDEGFAQPCATVFSKIDAEKKAADLDSLNLVTGASK